MTPKKKPGLGSFLKQRENELLARTTEPEDADGPASEPDLAVGPPKASARRNKPQLTVYVDRGQDELLLKLVDTFQERYRKANPWARHISQQHFIRLLIKRYGHEELVDDLYDAIVSDEITLK